MVLNRTLWDDIVNFGENITSKIKSESDNEPVKIVSFSSFGFEKVGSFLLLRF